MQTGVHGAPKHVIVEGSMDTLPGTRLPPVPAPGSDAASGPVGGLTVNPTNAAATVVDAPVLVAGPAAPTIASPDVRALAAAVDKESAFVDAVLNEVGKVVVGQKQLVERVLIGLLA